jgi:hypothetical protein
MTYEDIANLTRDDMAQVNEILILLNKSLNSVMIPLLSKLAELPVKHMERYWQV